MQIVSIIHEISLLIFQEKSKKYFKMPSAEIFTQHVKHLKKNIKW